MCDKSESSTKFPNLKFKYFEIQYLCVTAIILLVSEMDGCLVLFNKNNRCESFWMFIKVWNPIAKYQSHSKLLFFWFQKCMTASYIGTFWKKRKNRSESLQVDLWMLEFKYLEIQLFHVIAMVTFHLRIRVDIHLYYTINNLQLLLSHLGPSWW